MTKQKELLVNFLLLGFIFCGFQINGKNPPEYDLINHIVCKLDENSLHREFMGLELYKYNSYKRLNPKNRISVFKKVNFDLDSIFNELQREQIEVTLSSKKSSEIEKKYLSRKNVLFTPNTKKDYVLKKKLYSISYPIISKGLNNHLYGIVIESEVFELDGFTNFKIYRKDSVTWKLIYEELIGMS